VAAATAAAAIDDDTGTCCGDCGVVRIVMVMVAGVDAGEVNESPEGSVVVDAADDNGPSEVVVVVIFVVTVVVAGGLVTRSNLTTSPARICRWTRFTM
jgi:hypothetical protein